MDAQQANHNHDSPASASSSRTTPDTQLASFTFHPQQATSPLVGRSSQDPRASRDPFTGSSYKYFGMGNQGETAMPMVEQSNQSLTSYLEQAITPHGRNMNFSVATPPTGSVTGRSPTKFPAHGTVYGASTSVVPNSNARDSYGPPRYGSFNPYESPLHNRASFPSLTNERRFLIRNVDTDTEGLEIVQLFQNLRSVNGPFWTTLNTYGHFFVSFSDSRDADAAMLRIARDYSEWEMVPLSAEDFARDTRMVSPLPLSFDDYVMVTIYCGTYSSINPSDVVPRIRPFLELAGEVHTIQEVQFGIPCEGSRLTTHELAVRYFDCRHAANAIKTLNAIRTADFVMEVMPLHRDLPHYQQRHWTSVPKSRRQSVISPARRLYMSPSDQDGGSPVQEDPKPNRNMIDMSKIYYGQDTRTTVMLRNIPNQMTWQHLKQILDLTNAHTYDFMYLRMDFDQNQSVGYAFVNFILPTDIIALYEARDRMPWPGFEDHVEKIAEMSYATMQGRETLVEKFRNSPVMLNHPDNRPKLFHTNGPRIGRLETFPPVNNFQTLAKGVDRSKRSGLYRGPASSGARNSLVLPGSLPYSSRPLSMDSESSGAKDGHQHERDHEQTTPTPVRAQLPVEHNNHASRSGTRGNRQHGFGRGGSWSTGMRVPRTD